MTRYLLLALILLSFSTDALAQEGNGASLGEFYRACYHGDFRHPSIDIEENEIRVGKQDLNVVEFHLSGAVAPGDGIVCSAVYHTTDEALTALKNMIRSVEDATGQRFVPSERP